MRLLPQACAWGYRLSPAMRAFRRDAVGRLEGLVCVTPGLRLGLPSGCPLRGRFFEMRSADWRDWFAIVTQACAWGYHLDARYAGIPPRCGRQVGGIGLRLLPRLAPGATVCRPLCGRSAEMRSAGWFAIDTPGLRLGLPSVARYAGVLRDAVGRLEGMVCDCYPRLAPGATVRRPLSRRSAEMR